MASNSGVNRSELSCWCTNRPAAARLLLGLPSRYIRLSSASPSCSGCGSLLSTGCNGRPGKGVTKPAHSIAAVPTPRRRGQRAAAAARVGCRLRVGCPIGEEHALSQSHLTWSKPVPIYLLTYLLWWCSLLLLTYLLTYWPTGPLCGCVCFPNSRGGAPRVQVRQSALCTPLLPLRTHRFFFAKVVY